MAFSCAFTTLCFVFAVASAAKKPVEKSSPRILGGEIARIEDFPYQLLMSSGCGASIISDRWVLSAGHCYEGSINDTSFYAGSAIREKGENYEVSEAYVHPGYNNETSHYDIGLFKIKGSFNFSNPNIQPIALAAANTEIPPEEKLIVSGWGRTNKDTVPDQMLTATATVLNLLICSLSLPTWKITDRQICSVGGFTHTCDGDSGSPVVLNGKQVGIVSLSTIDCAQNPALSVFTNVANPEIRAWITKISGL